MARLAKPADAAYIKKLLDDRGQFRTPEAIIASIASSNEIWVVDPPLGLFWAYLDSEDRTLVHAGITFSGSVAQTKALYKVALLAAQVVWPQWTDLDALIDPTSCSAGAYQGATLVAGMTMVSQGERWQTFKRKRVDVEKAVGVRAG